MQDLGLLITHGIGLEPPANGKWDDVEVVHPPVLDNKFATLPYVVGEGRRVIGNIERVSNLFLTKTVYSVLLAILVGLAGLAFGQVALTRIDFVLVVGPPLAYLFYVWLTRRWMRAPCCVMRRMLLPRK